MIAALESEIKTTLTGTDLEKIQWAMFTQDCPFTSRTERKSRRVTITTMTIRPSDRDKVRGILRAFWATK